MNEPTRSLFALWAVCAALCALLLISAARADEPDCVTITHCAVMSLPIWHEDTDEDPAEQSSRLLNLANGIDTATGDRLERALLIQQAHSETRFANFVMTDAPRCREGLGGWCDGGRAFGPWQLHFTDRTETLAEQAEAAIRQLRYGGTYCRRKGYDYLEGAISVYATGQLVCDWPEAKQRARKTWVIWRVIQ